MAGHLLGDFANQPTQVRSGSTVIGAYTYDGNLKRVKQVQGGETVYSIYSVDGRLLHRDNATTGEKDDHLFLGGMEIARSSDVSTDFTHTDHLGSPVAQTSWAGGLNWREDYTPYGEKRQNPVGNRDSTGYTGHVQDHVTGLTYMQARFYDPVVGRFLSNDPVGFSPDKSFLFNRYSYAANDPVNMVDPDGELPVLAIPAAIKGGEIAVVAAVGTAAAAIAWVQSGGPDKLAESIGNIFTNDDASGTYTTPGGREIAHGKNSEGYVNDKGWTPEQIDEVLDNPAGSYENDKPNHRTGERQTTHTDGNGNWVVTDESGRVTQVNERGNDRQQMPEPKVEEN